MGVNANSDHIINDKKEKKRKKISLKKKIIILIVIILIIVTIWELYLPFIFVNDIEVVTIDVELTINETKPDDELWLKTDHWSRVKLNNDKLEIENNVYDKHLDAVILMEYSFDRDIFDSRGPDKTHYLRDGNNLITIKDLFCESISIYKVNVDKDKVTINDTIIKPSHEWSGTFSYTIMEGKYTITEKIKLKNEGYMRPRITMAKQYE
ncbi:MAG: hypothetical protein JSV49_08440 [Thermoplasmata archaeon]|nr:MAG: hypothetical protein JSV49_08440 [Thermoplasmata archaeon]